MYKIKFTIDKENLFIYWLQISSGFTKAEHTPIFLRKYIEFNKEQKSLLKKFRDILFKKNNGYNWLYSFYKNKKIENDLEKVEFKEIKKGLLPFFENVWREEIPKLRKKKWIFEKYDFMDLNNFINQLEIFIGKPLNKTIDVQLFFSKYKKISGATHKNAHDFIILFCSDSDLRYKKDITTTIAHEITHLFLYTIDAKLKKSFKEIFSDINLGKYKKDFTIRDTVHEIITVSLCGGYLFSGYFSTTYLGIKQKKKDTRNARSKFIFSVAEKIYPLTKDYLENAKLIDSDYIDFVLQQTKKQYLKQ